MSDIIIGLCGEICSGKGMIEAHLRKRYDCDYTRFSMPLARGLEALGFGPPPHAREDLQDVSTFLRKGRGELPPGAIARWIDGYRDSRTDYAAFVAQLDRLLAVFHHAGAVGHAAELLAVLERGLGEDILARTIDKDCEKSTKPCVIVDGVRRDADIVRLGRRPNFHLIYVTAPIEDRFEWAKARNEKAGDAALTWEKFVKQNQAETEREIPIVGAKAHLIIRNGKHRKEEEVLAELDAYLDGIGDPIASG